MIGANGAGKSTLLKTLSGLLRPKEGTIEYLDKSIVGKPAQAIVKAGISHVPEGRRVFAEMSVEENIELGAFLRKDKDGIQQDFQKVYETFPRLYTNGANNRLGHFQAESSRCWRWEEQ